MANMTHRRESQLRTKAGEVLTGHDIDALAAEAEAGYELTQAKPRRVGRPSLEVGISPRVSFRTSRRLYEVARERAAKEGRSVSELAREAVERYVAAGSGS